MVTTGRVRANAPIHPGTGISEGLVRVLGLLSISAKRDGSYSHLSDILQIVGVSARLLQSLIPARFVL